MSWNCPKKQKGSESKSELHPSRSSAKQRPQRAAAICGNIPFLSDETTSFFGWQYPISGFKLIETQSSTRLPQRMTQLQLSFYEIFWVDLFLVAKYRHILLLPWLTAQFSMIRLWSVWIWIIFTHLKQVILGRTPRVKLTIVSGVGQ